MAKRTTLALLSLWGAFASGQGLHDLAVKNGKLFFGTATDTNLFNDAAYMAVLNRTGEFGLVVPENSQKWDATEKTQGQFTFTNPDAVRALPSFGKYFLSENVARERFIDESAVSQGTWTPETLTPVIEAHISNTVAHFAGACYSWDVVNEALADNGTLRDSVFSRTLGQDFIPISFRAAAAADPAAKLYYNDFSLEFNSKKTDGAVKIVQDLKAAGVRIDGLGLQAHLEVGKTPSPQTLSKVMSRFTDMGLEVALTELDIRHGKVPADDAAVQQQAKDYASVVKTCVDAKGCVGVVVWEFTDKYSWIPSTFQGQGDACLFDKDMNPKPAYDSIKAVLMAGATNATVKSTAGSAEEGSGAGRGAMAAVQGLVFSSGAARSRPLGAIFSALVMGMSLDSWM
uniref:Beta-xylanase n=1 Tax=Colletotrichum fructicola (strain Nara gc5) TaxID=1213859 RepID=L2FLQ3_COLFN